MHPFSLLQRGTHLEGHLGLTSFLVGKNLKLTACVNNSSILSVRRKKFRPTRPNKTQTKNIYILRRTLPSVLAEINGNGVLVRYLTIPRPIKYYQAHTLRRGSWWSFWVPFLLVRLRVHRGVPRQQHNRESKAREEGVNVVGKVKYRVHKSQNLMASGVSQRYSIQKLTNNLPS